MLQYSMYWLSSPADHAWLLLLMVRYPPLDDGLQVPVQIQMEERGIHSPSQPNAVRSVSILIRRQLSPSSLASLTHWKCFSPSLL